ncbi:MAG TPA: GxxExxY protein [Sphingomicrobium sp.]|nr:GxxExxY protein [Sphingomicrobium sp.]
MTDIEELARVAVDCGFHIHKKLGPGLLESVYEAVLAARLERSGLRVERQKPIAIEFEDLVIADGFRADLVIDDRLIVEVKSVERTAPIHAKQLLTYLRLTEQPLGLLMNFGCETFREGVKRVVNGPSAFVPPQQRTT